SCARPASSGGSGNSPQGSIPTSPPPRWTSFGPRCRSPSKGAPSRWLGSLRAPASPRSSVPRSAAGAGRSRPELQRSSVPGEGEQGVHLDTVAAEAVGAAEIGQVDDEGSGHDLAAGALDELHG